MLLCIVQAARTMDIVQYYAVASGKQTDDCLVSKAAGMSTTAQPKAAMLLVWRCRLLTFPAPDAGWHALAGAALHLLPFAARHQAAQCRGSCLACSTQTPSMTW
jgi:hypothetical protein